MSLYLEDACLASALTFPRSPRFSSAWCRRAVAFPMLVPAATRLSVSSAVFVPRSRLRALLVDSLPSRQDFLGRRCLPSTRSVCTGRGAPVCECRRREPAVRRGAPEGTVTPRLSPSFPRPGPAHLPERLRSKSLFIQNSADAPGITRLFPLGSPRPRPSGPLQLCPRGPRSLGSAASVGLPICKDACS